MGDEPKFSLEDLDKELESWRTYLDQNNTGTLF